MSTDSQALSMKNKKLNTLQLKGSAYTKENEYLQSQLFFKVAFRKN